jgi:uncharacterized membrane protein
MISRIYLIWLSILVAADVLLSAFSVWKLPTKVPLHWSFQGQIDRYGSPWELAIVFPIFVAISAALLIGLPAIAPLRESLIRSRTIYGRIALVIVGCVIALHAIFLIAVSGQPIDVSRAAFALVGVMLLVLGNWMGKLRRNGVVGIRTPWTLKSDIVWERTHRLGGRLQVLHACAVIVSSLLFPFWATFILIVGGLLSLATWSMIYSARIEQTLRRSAGNP